MTLAMLLGLALDSANGWRNAAMLGAAADTGSHAGAVALARGRSEAEAIEAARNMVRANLPPAQFGDTVADSNDIALMHYDAETGRLSLSGPKNAVAVNAGRLAERGNPVRTFLLGFAGVDAFDVNAVSASVFDYSSQCLGTDGIYSESQIRASSQNDFGPGFCMHSNDHVRLPQNNTFGQGSLVSMPDLENCGNTCDPVANPGVRVAEINMILPDIGDHIRATHDAFADSGMPVGSPKEAFFLDRFVSDLTPLHDAGVVPAGETRTRGEVIELTHAEFHAIPALPSGLVYSVSCPATGGPSSELAFSATAGQMVDAALLTDCAIDFGSDARIEGSLVITTRERPNATVTGHEDARIGDGLPGDCLETNRSTIMSLSSVRIPAKMAASNVTLIVDDTVDIASSSALGSTSHGLTIYASGPVDIATQHSFQSCGPSDETLVPRGKIIRLVATN